MPDLRSSRGEDADRQIVFVCSELLPTIPRRHHQGLPTSSIVRLQSGELAISD